MTTQELDAERELKFSPDDLDLNIKPGNDFYHFAVGNWLKKHPIPDDHSRWGIFEVLSEFNKNILKGIVENPGQFKNMDDESLAEKVSVLYDAGLNQNEINKLGVNPVKTYLDKIDDLKTVDEMVSLVGILHRSVCRPMFNLLAVQDAKNSEMVITGLMQGGLGLPERDYYLSEDEHSKMIREKYVEHIGNLIVLSGENNEEANETAEIVMKVEKRLAEHMRTKEELRDPVKNYYKMDYEAVRERYGNFNWKIYFESLGLNPVEIDVQQVEYFDELNTMLNVVPLEDWKKYLKVAVIRAAAEYLSEPFEKEKFNFYGKILNGLKQMKPRWRRVIGVVDDLLGKALGKLYIRDNFSPIAKERAGQLVKNITIAMERRINDLQWMGDATKKEAIKKLHAINVKVGFPDVWYSYDSLHIGKDLSYFEIVVRCSEFEVKRELDKIGKPVDKTEWLMNPQTVNAYYEPSKNEIVFPAGILQPPFFDDSADDALNYGGIGAVIGHEITHAFDDQGRQYDAVGNLRDWWTKEDEVKFKERAKKLIEQYNGFELLPGVFVNGEFTQGENIADLGGLQVAYDAFMLTGESRAGEFIDDFPPKQRFFLSYAQTWKTNIREELARLYIRVDPHSPGVFRTNGPLSNMLVFYEAFNVTKEDAMYRDDEKRVIIW